MLWSKWRGAVVLMLACVGLAWSQQTTPVTTTATNERIMTVQENGKSLRCRVLSTWTMPDGSTAYQLQALDTGEMITIVEDGPALKGKGKLRALPMRIFHWGQGRRTPPPGSPVPPGGVILPPDGDLACSNCQNCQKSASSRLFPVFGRKGSEPAVAAMPSEQVIWWEEKDGKRVSPEIVTHGSNPFQQGQVVDQFGKPLPQGPAGVPTVVVQGSPGESATLPKIVEQSKSSGPWTTSGNSGKTTSVSPSSPPACPYPVVTTPSSKTDGGIKLSRPWWKSQPNTPPSVVQAPIVQGPAPVIEVVESTPTAILPKGAPLDSSGKTITTAPTPSRVQWPWVKHAPVESVKEGSTTVSGGTVKSSVVPPVKFPTRPTTTPAKPETTTVVQGSTTPVFPPVMPAVPSLTKEPKTVPAPAPRIHLPWASAPSASVPVDGSKNVKPSESSKMAQTTPTYAPKMGTSAPQVKAPDIGPAGKDAATQEHKQGFWAKVFPGMKAKDQPKTPVAQNSTSLPKPLLPTGEKPLAISSEPQTPAALAQNSAKHPAFQPPEKQPALPEGVPALPSSISEFGKPAQVAQTQPTSPKSTRTKLFPSAEPKPTDTLPVSPITPKGPNFAASPGALPLPTPVQAQAPSKAALPKSTFVQTGPTLLPSRAPLKQPPYKFPLPVEPAGQEKPMLPDATRVAQTTPNSQGAMLPKTPNSNAPGAGAGSNVPAGPHTLAGTQPGDKQPAGSSTAKSGSRLLPFPTPKTPTTQTAAAGDKRVPFSTAADPNVGAKSPPSAAGVQPKGAAPSGKLPTAKNTKDVLAQEGDTKQTEAKATAKTPPKRDWRLMWGQAKENKVQAPGQSLLEQTAKSKVDTGLKQAFMPPTSTMKDGNDILLNPEKFDPEGERLNPKGINLASYRGDPSQALQPPSLLDGKTPPPPASVLAAQHAQHGQPAGKGIQPLGAKSVLAGYTMPSRVAYVPVPVATVPEPIRPPSPPPPNMPEPPQPNAFVNAFSQPVPPAKANPMTQNMMTDPNAAAAAAYPPNPMLAQGPAPWFYGPPAAAPMIAPNGRPIAQVNYPNAYAGPLPPNPNGPQAQALPQPIPSAMMPPGMTQQALIQQAMMQQALMQQGLTPHGMQGPQAMMMQLQVPVTLVPMTVPQNGAAPHGVQPAQYTPAPQGNAQIPAAQPLVNQAMDRRSTPASAVGNPQEIAQLLQVLRESPYPAQREWAANSLATFDWRLHPEVVQALITSAQQDPAATVRAGCVYGLARMNAASEPVLAALQTLRNDGDNRVRQEVEQALIRLGVKQQ